MQIGSLEGTLRRSAALATTVALAAYLLGGSAAAQAQESANAGNRTTKPAWQWTLEERLAARFDPAGLKARAEKDAAMRQQTAAQFGESFDAPAEQHSIDGKREPQLFLPIELVQKPHQPRFSRRWRRSSLRWPGPRSPRAPRATT